jgi:hypothetical protein
MIALGQQGRGSDGTTPAPYLRLTLLQLATAQHFRRSAALPPGSVPNQPKGSRAAIAALRAAVQQQLTPSCASQLLQRLAPSFWEVVGRRPVSAGWRKRATQERKDLCAFTINEWLRFIEKMCREDKSNVNTEYAVGETACTPAVITAMSHSVPSGRLSTPVVMPTTCMHRNGARQLAVVGSDWPYVASALTAFSVNGIAFGLYGRALDACGRVCLWCVVLSHRVAGCCCCHRTHVHYMCMCASALHVHYMYMCVSAGPQELQLVLETTELYAASQEGTSRWESLGCLLQACPYPALVEFNTRHGRTLLTLAERSLEAALALPATASAGRIALVRTSTSTSSSSGRSRDGPSDTASAADMGWEPTASLLTCLSRCLMGGPRATAGTGAAGSSSYEAKGRHPAGVCSNAKCGVQGCMVVSGGSGL